MQNDALNDTKMKHDKCVVLTGTTGNCVTDFYYKSVNEEDMMTEIPAQGTHQAGNSCNSVFQL